MREQEHGWEPYGPAMIVKAKASLDSNGKIVDWNSEVWSNTHSMRPGSPGNLLAGGLVAKAFPPDAPQDIPLPAGGGDRNAVPLYQFPSSHVVNHFIPQMPMRVSALRSLGAYMNVFSIESFMDELALAAKADPVQFRLDYLKDERARAVVQLAADKFGWSKAESLPRGHGRGFAFARYKNLAAYCAVALEVEVTRETGGIRPIRAVAACDSGLAVNPDGIRNQIEGAIMQSLSWTLYEEVSFSQQRVTSLDWASYPILRFPDVPTVEVHIIDQPGQKFLGTGEAGQGPAAAALANAVANATGARIRDLPMRPERVMAALGV
jgi:CO/xanthine dehydrogenase Mo-binding subunit